MNRIPSNWVTILDKYFLALGFNLCLLACQPSQTVPVRQASHKTDSLLTLRLINASAPYTISLSDSVISLKLPMFEVVVDQSATPVGRLDKQGGQMVDPLYHRRNLYNEAGQPAGHCSSSLPIDPLRSVTYYEYKDNRIYRVYARFYDAITTKTFIYRMEELGYTANRATTVSSYYLDLTKGTAAFQSILDLIYDSQGQVTSIRDRRPGTAYPVFTWENGNVKTREEFLGDGTPLGIFHTYRYDNKPNPLNALGLPYQELPLFSTNNLTADNVRYSKPTLVDQTDFQLTYDADGRLASSTQVDHWPFAPKNPTYVYSYK